MNKTTSILFAILSLNFIYILNKIYTNRHEQFIKTDLFDLSEIETLSVIIFLIFISFSLVNFNWFIYLTPFFLISFPSVFNNLLPNVNASDKFDYNSTFIPLITHIDVYLLTGLLRYYKPQKIIVRNLNFYIITLVLGLLIVSGWNLFSYKKEVEKLILLSGTYHIRFIILIFLTLNLTPALEKLKSLKKGIFFSFAFLISESLVYTHYYDLERLTSGSIGNNLLAGLFLMFYVFYVKSYKLNKCFYKYISVSILFFVIIYLTKTRSAFFLLTLFYLYNYWHLRFKYKPVLLLVPILSFLLISFSIESSRYNLFNLKFSDKTETSNFEKNEILENNPFNESLNLRIRHFETSLKMIKQNPIFGVGSNMWNYNKRKYGSKDKNYLDSHNEILALTSQYGIIIGLALFIFILFPILCFANSIEKAKVPQDRYLMILFLIPLILGTTNTLFFKYPIFAMLTFVSFFTMTKLSNKQL